MSITFPLPWCGRNAMALEDITHRLVADRIAQVFQGSSNTMRYATSTTVSHVASEYGESLEGNQGKAWAWRVHKR